MSNLRRLLLVLCTLLSLGVFAQTGEEYAQEAERATRLLDKAVAHYKANGESAFAAFSRQGVFVDGELYVYVVDT
ncbi:TPA: calcium channel protein, partial [Pseudomonas aeruginosa]|nr:calcium channel protein [Pseudomonas aeruginosa]